MATQRKGLGTTINEIGYKVMSNFDLSGKEVLEFGPGDMYHHKFWRGYPSKYYIADIHEEMLSVGEEILKQKNIQYESHLISRNQSLEIECGSIDVIISFYTLEHLHPLDEYLKDLASYLKPGGMLIGAIPAEGGLLWGTGRYFTSRKWIMKNTNIDYEKLICWEHPNFGDFVIERLDSLFERVNLRSWPFSFFPVLDGNLIFSFCYQKKGHFEHQHL